MKRICAECRHFGSQVVAGHKTGACKFSPPAVASDAAGWVFMYPIVDLNDTCASWSPVDRAQAVCGNCQWFRPAPALLSGDVEDGQCYMDPWIKYGSGQSRKVAAGDTCASWSLRDEPEKPDTED